MYRFNGTLPQISQTMPLRNSCFSLVLLCLAQFALSQTYISETIYFDSDQATLRSNVLPVLKTLCVQSLAASDYEVLIKAHTDQDGSLDYNMNLAQARAKSVADFLKVQGLHNSQMTIQSYGETNLISDDDCASCKQRNRRVQIEIQLYHFQNISDALSSLETSYTTVEEVIPNPLSAQEVQFLSGLTLDIPANAFEYKDGTPIGKETITLTLKEAYEYGDMLKFQLHTMSDGHPLESGGMVQLEAKAKGKPLTLQKGKSLEISFPASEVSEGMTVFMGNMDAGSLDWEDTGSTVSIEDDSPFIEIDLHLLDSLVAENYQAPTDPSLQMIHAKPAKPKKPYPPSSKIYYGDKYKELHEKYLRKKESYDLEVMNYPARKKKWDKAVEERLRKIYGHYSAMQLEKVRSSFIRQTSRALERRERVSHDLIIKFLTHQASRKYESVDYNITLAMKTAFGKYANEVSLDYVPAFTSKTHFNYTREFLASVSIILQKLSKAVKKKRIEIVGFDDQSSLRRYVFTTTELGWINVDKLRKRIPGEMTSFALSTASHQQQAYLIYKDIKSMLSLSGTGTPLQIPKNERVRLVVIEMRGNKMFMESLDFLSGEITSTKVGSLKKCSRKDLMKAFDIS